MSTMCLDCHDKVYVELGICLVCNMKPISDEHIEYDSYTKEDVQFSDGDLNQWQP
ncbi:hypothetical protein [Flagellimonas marina]|uniref:Uncharacterized protein n=1 Tax=Flagellimonas marina TaxID=1775168 RepID=A0ABV8PHC2_9FLAO